VRVLSRREDNVLIGTIHCAGEPATNSVRLHRLRGVRSISSAHSSRKIGLDFGKCATTLPIFGRRRQMSEANSLRAERLSDIVRPIRALTRSLYFLLVARGAFEEILRSLYQNRPRS
jgi:hypothetical protein